MPGERPAADELADLAGADERVAGVVDDVHRHPERRPADGARLDRPDRGRREEARADLGAAGAVDDRHARAADVLEEPAVRLGVPRLAGRDERAQRREVARRVAVREQRARERRREAERGDALLLDRRQRRSGVGQSGAPSAKTIVAPSAPTPTTVHGPMIQPMSVAKCTTSPACTSAW